LDGEHYIRGRYLSQNVGIYYHNLAFADFINDILNSELSEEYFGFKGYDYFYPSTKILLF